MCIAQEETSECVGEGVIVVIAMPRRLAEFIGCESVTTKSKLCNILKIKYL
jgi:hypothetical protein